MTRTKCNWGLTAAAMLFVGVWTASADYVILNNDTRLEGQIQRRKLDGTVVIKVSRADGGSAVQEFAKGSYKSAVCDPPPPEFAVGVKAANDKQWQAAIDALEKVADDKQGLEVDKQARYVIARCLIQLGKAPDAVAQFDKIAKIYGEEIRKDPQVAVEYANALLAAKQNTKLSGVLDDIIKDAPRPAAAKAQNLRGQMREQQGQLDAALLDYMRTAYFFSRDGGDAVPEGLYRAAKVLDLKRDPRAKMLYKQVVDGYRDSPYAREAAGHI